jgi:hypothetical protein
LASTKKLATPKGKTFLDGELEAAYARRRFHMLRVSNLHGIFFRAGKLTSNDPFRVLKAVRTHELAS